MRMRGLFLLASCCTAALAAQTANADVTIPVPAIPNSVFTVASDINDKNIVTGFFADSTARVHGFYEALDGSSYTIFDDSAGVVLPTSIDNAGVITGETIVTDQLTCDAVPFERNLDGSVVHIDKGKKSLNGLAAGLNNRGEFVGYYCDKNGGVYSYYGKNGRYKSPLIIAGSPIYTIANDINKSGMVAGYFGVRIKPTTGFVLHNGVTDIVEYPNASVTQPTAIDDRGLVLGTWTDSQSNTRVFTFDVNDQSFHDIPVFTGSISAGMNNKGLLVIEVPNTFQSYIYCLGSAKKCARDGAHVDSGQIHSTPVSTAASQPRSIPANLKLRLFPSLLPERGAP